MAKYRLDNVVAVQDGSGLVRFDVWALDADDVIIPSKHKDVMLPMAELAAAMQLAVTPRIAAIKALLLLYAGDGWDNDGLDAEALLNTQTTDVAAAVNAWITVPQTFAL